MLRRLCSLFVSVVVVLAIGPAEASGGASEERFASRDTYTNPVADEFTRNFADPSMIRGRDGYWYAYATGGRHAAGDTYHRLSIARSADLVTWEFVGDVFTEDTEPTYDGKGPDARRMYWAPAIEHFGGRYLLYYSYVVNDGADRSWRAIGVAVAPTPAGPWTDSGEHVTGPETWEPRPGETAWRNVIDPEVVTADDGTRYLYYGSVLGGVRAVKLSPDGLRAVGERTQITPEHRYEAAYLVRRGDFYYLFLSVIGGCCAGPVSAYPLVVARSRNPLGPFVDRDGFGVRGRHAGGSPVQTPNGNKWVSVAHNAMVTDFAGQDWLVTHGLNRTDPYVAGTENARHLMINRLDWIDGWPLAWAGAGLPGGPAAAPVADGVVADAFESGSAPGDAWEPADGWSVRQGEAGGHLHADAGQSPRLLTSARALRGDIRVRASLRLGGDGSNDGGGGDERGAGSAGFQLASHGDGGGVRAFIDRGAEALVVEVRNGDRVVSRHADALPSTFRHTDWHELAVRVRDGRLHAEVSDAGLHDSVANVAATVPDGLTAGPLGLLAEGAPADVDDVTAAPLHTPVTTPVPDPTVGTPDASHSDEFDDGLGPEWSWVRAPRAETVGGKLRFDMQHDTLVDRRPAPDDTASALLRQVPPGPWTAETKVTVPFGDSLPYGWPQAGIIAYAGDDDWTTLSYGTRVAPRYASFGKEMTYQGRQLYAHAALGPTADTMWLRLRHRVDPDNGEHEYRAATSVDGEDWVWHGVRILPAGPQPRVGVIAFGAEDNPATGSDQLAAQFDYLRFYTPSSSLESP